jgi:hypothetical protein
MTRPTNHWPLASEGNPIPGQSKSVLGTGTSFHDQKSTEKKTNRVQDGPKDLKAPNNKSPKPKPELGSGMLLLMRKKLHINARDESVLL